MRRALRVANCSGAAGDPPEHMYNQAKLGPVDVITGDYLAEVNLAQNAEAYSNGAHPGWLPTAWEGIEKTIELVNKKRIKIIINGGSLNPRGLAEKTHSLIASKKLDLKVAYVEGDNLMPIMPHFLGKLDEHSHLDANNECVTLAPDALSFVNDPEKMTIVSANAYLGFRAIKLGLDKGADLIICGRVSDASPVIGAAAWWHQWADSDYDQLAGALVAGHLIECSTYITGANFAGFYKYETEKLIRLGLPIIEIEANGECTVTKHPTLNGFVTEDTVRCQLLYELQGDIYLNSDVKADISNIRIIEEAKDRVHVSGVIGYPPPPTTKLAIFYKGGYQAELLINATGFATPRKFDLQEAQLRTTLADWGLLERLDVLDFQRVGTPAQNPTSQLASTTYLRIFAQAKDAEALARLPQAWVHNGMAHFAGMHCSLDWRTSLPVPFLGYYPALIDQAEIEESISIIGSSDTEIERLVVGSPVKTEALEKRSNYETANPVDLVTFGATVVEPLGNIALARSGDKGANVNIGFFVHTADEWDWLRSFLTRRKMQQLMGSDWRDSYYLERVEFPNIKAVHFVIYGPLGRGVSSGKSLDGLGKGMAEFIRDVHVPIPKRFLG